MLPSVVMKHSETNPQTQRMKLQPYPTPKLQIFTTIAFPYLLETAFTPVAIDRLG